MGIGHAARKWQTVDVLDPCRRPARQFHFCAEKKLLGIFNAGGPEPVTNADFSRALASALKRPYPFRGWVSLAVH